MIGGRRADRDRADLHLVSRDHLDHVLEPTEAQHRPQAPRHDDLRRRAQAPERPQVEVVVVGMGDQHGLCGRQLARRLDEAPEVDDAPAEDGIGQEPDAVELDRHRAVTKPGDAIRRCHACDPKSAL